MACVWTTPSPTSTAIVSVTFARPAAWSVLPDLGCQLTVNRLVDPRTALTCVTSFRSERRSEVRRGVTCTARSFSGISNSRLLTPTAGHCTAKLRPSAADSTPTTRLNSIWCLPCPRTSNSYRPSPTPRSNTAPFSLRDEPIAASPNSTGNRAQSALSTSTSKVAFRCASSPLTDPT